MRDLSAAPSLKVKKCFVESFAEIIDNSNKTYLPLLLDMVLGLDDCFQGLLSAAIFAFLLKIYSFTNCDVA